MGEGQGVASCHAKEHGSNSCHGEDSLYGPHSEGCGSAGHLIAEDGLELHQVRSPEVIAKVKIPRDRIGQVPEFALRKRREPEPSRQA